jgi:heme-degrading monooxygenase HmoA
MTDDTSASTQDNAQLMAATVTTYLLADDADPARFDERYQNHLKFLTTVAGIAGYQASRSDGDRRYVEYIWWENKESMTAALDSAAYRDSAAEALALATADTLAGKFVTQANGLDETEHDINAALITLSSYETAPGVKTADFEAAFEAYLQAAVPRAGFSYACLHRDVRRPERYASIWYWWSADTIQEMAAAPEHAALLELARETSEEVQPDTVWFTQD